MKVTEQDKEQEMIKWSNGNIELSKSKNADTWYVTLTKNLDYYLSKEGKINKEQYLELDRDLFQVKLSLTKLDDYHNPTRLAVPNMLRTLKQLRQGGSKPDFYDLQEKFIETAEMLSEYLQTTGYSPYVYLSEEGQSGLGIYTKKQMDSILDKQINNLLAEPKQDKEHDNFYTSVMDACNNLKDELKTKGSLKASQTLSQLSIETDSTLESKVGLVANEVLLGYWRERLRRALA